ncbi:START-like domain superfamily [Sesbania bispinosa]|nr:START-like domain superfamily [Sesbania bispinosa]
MDFPMGGAGGSGDEDAQNSHKGKRPSYKRLDSTQTSILEKFIKECPHPDEAQRRQLADEVGLEPKQIKFWFQNKRTQIKVQHERADNNALRAENDRMLSENILMKEALKNTLCPDCGGPPFPEGEHELFMQKMQRENAKLKEEASQLYERVSDLLARYLEKHMTTHEIQQTSIPITGPSSHELALDGSSSSSLGQSFNLPIMDNHILFNNSMESSDMEKELMSEIATAAMEELVKLIRINDPLWVISSAQKEKLTLHRETYERIFPKTNHMKGANVRLESSKDSGIVNISGKELVDIFLDADKWANLFPAIVTKAETIKVFENGLLGNRSGTLQMMYEEMHVLSHLVRPREFYFLRYCQQVDIGVWMIADVSFDSIRVSSPLYRSWRYPSGCMIHEIANGRCMVTWVEHVEVDDKIHTHRLYRDLVGVNVAYGAGRWIFELQRMCERFASFYVEKIPDHKTEGALYSLEGRKSVMKLAHRMVKTFCESLTMSGHELDFPHLTVENNSGVRVNVRKSGGIGQPNGTIVMVATSLWLPLHYENVFEFLTDHKRRAQWDVLACGNPVHLVAHISNGIHPGNCISIIQPFIPSENNAVILQESFIHPMGSYIVYAPTDVTAMNVAMRGEDSSVLSILPSGFVICADDQPKVDLGAIDNGNIDRSGGSLLTVVFQVLASSPDGINLLNMESVATVNTLLTSTVQRVREALN